MAVGISQKQLAECYQPLFELMYNEHDKILIISEMDEIIAAAFKVSNAVDNLYQEVCDVDGCNLIRCNGGVCWPETGYWSVCQIHSVKYRDGESQPIMKKEAIEREASRLPDGCLPN